MREEVQFEGLAVTPQTVYRAPVKTPLTEPVTAIVLAGGASSRMGSPKALLPFGKETLLERVIRRISEISTDIVVVTGEHVALPALPEGVRVVVDEIPLQGPLAGILYGLRAAQTDLCFVCSCDLPFLGGRLARALLDLAGDFDAVVPRWGQHLQPMLAVYRRRLIPVFEELLAAGRLGPSSVLERANGRELASEEIERIEPGGASFFDIDTPEAYEEALRLEQRG